MTENNAKQTSTSRTVNGKQLEQSVDDSICMAKNNTKQTVALTTNKTTVKTTKTVAIQCDQLSFHQNDLDRIIIARPLIDEVSGQQQKHINNNKQHDRQHHSIQR